MPECGAHRLGVRGIADRGGELPVRLGQGVPVLTGLPSAWWTRGRAGRPPVPLVLGAPSPRRSPLAAWIIAPPSLPVLGDAVVGLEPRVALAIAALDDDGRR